MKRVITVLALFCAVSFAYMEERNCYFANSIIRSNLLQERNGIYFFPVKNKPYTGKFLGCSCSEYDGCPITMGNGKFSGYDCECDGHFVIGNMENGKLHGERKLFYENGNLQSVGNYKDGIPYGEHKSFYGGEKLWSVGNYKDGMLYGEYKLFYVNGKLQSVMNYKDGKLHGEWKSFDVNGNLQSVGDYKDGKPHGEWKSFDENGNLIKEQKW